MNEAPVLNGITSCTLYANGNVCECRVNEENVLQTSAGALVPRYSRPGVREKELKSLSFYANGSLRSIYLEAQTEIPTPIGPFPAELVTFYEDGAIDSVFPLNGQIGFAWSEEEEGELAQVYEFPLAFGRITVKLNGLRFYPDGKLKSLIFWPGAVVPLHTPGGDFSGRIGVRLHDNGNLESFEPAVPVVLNTPIGPVPAFDVNALAVDADFNSIRFDRKGKLVQLKTSGDIVVQSAGAGRKIISSRTRMGLMDDTVAKLPLALSFAGNMVTIDDGVERFTYDIADCKFLILPDFDRSGFNCTGDCNGCSC
ncbi:hypothetical protein [Desulfitobacterium chlororespirans]|uniref:Uncharacterized protein n=1 Tax=Desulfitobacterium chlororespirans DSM 11544 TaxID=1121395 RepID=A0A1M7TR95_9FIRM|nr:hypothetical protein [Desulfitobacterium chlororespirans]SHN73274.1 hypothetical protein SAMN02745215_02435 [Desulfitobacterium chlororespirans DSM 11544]